MINGETIYQNRLGRIVANHASLQKRCTTLNPVKECNDYAKECGSPRHVMALACLLPQHRPENWDNSGWSETSPEEIFGDWTLDNHPLYAN